MFEYQADQHLPNHWLRVIGAARTYAQRIQFFTGVPQVLMIAVLFYNDAPILHTIFPTVYHWIAGLLVGVAAAILIDRVVLHPAQIVYNQYQHGRENRSPNYRETMANQRRLDRIEDKLDEVTKDA